ncbi:RNA-metabolizing metallo-beta-lactamase [Streptomyces sp. PanSC19]|nr:RNA-metabolizing metallo-beta-lactamase [Streptomyces sp. PanSC19]
MGTGPLRRRADHVRGSAEHHPRRSAARTAQSPGRRGNGHRKQVPGRERPCADPPRLRSLPGFRDPAAPQPGAFRPRRRGRRRRGRHACPPGPLRLSAPPGPAGLPRTGPHQRPHTRLRETGVLPRSVPVYVDSPMALAALDVYRDAVRERSPELRPEILAEGAAALSPEPFLAARTVQESIRINETGGPAVIVSSAGMATGGRVLHHLRRLLPDPRNAVVVVGFAAAGTRARDLVDGARVLKMFGEYVPVRAEVADVPHFSAHADADQILGWLRGAPPPHTTYLVHGEPAASETLRDRVDRELGWTAVVPRSGEAVLVR